MLRVWRDHAGAADLEIAGMPPDFSIKNKGQTMTETKAYAAHTAKEALKPFTVERRETGDYDVAIDIKYCGICHSDIHQARDEWGGGSFPMVPGHEIAGIVSKVGPKVTKFRAGDRVGVGCFVDSCRSCHDSAHKHEVDREQYFPDELVLTYNGREHSGAPTFGGYSQKIVVKEDYVLRIPENLPLDAAAPLLCAGITLYSPLKHWGAGPGKKVAIIGMGGLGHVGVKLAHALGAEVTVLSQSLSKQDDGKRMGASHYYATNDKETFTKLRRSFDLIVCTVSAPIDWNAYLELLKVDGSMVLIGVPDQPVPVNAFGLIGGRRNLSGTLIGSIKETQEMLDFCGKHNVVADIEVIPMEGVNDAYERVVKSDVRYRFVIDMASLG
jgi:uncharacterized zinc-type alcohol dehydrogenase-like protein